MNFLRRLSSFFSARPPSAETRFFTVYLFNHRCQEPISGRLDLLNDLSLGEEGEATYHARKVFHTSGADRCFSQVEVEFWFDANKRLVNKEVTGGRWLEEGEYHTIVEEQAAQREAQERAAEEAKDAAADRSPAADTDTH